MTIVVSLIQEKKQKHSAKEIISRAIIEKVVEMKDMAALEKGLRK